MGTWTKTPPTRHSPKLDDSPESGMTQPKVHGAWMTQPKLDDSAPKLDDSAPESDDTAKSAWGVDDTAPKCMGHGWHSQRVGGRRISSLQRKQTHDTFTLNNTIFCTKNLVDKLHIEHQYLHIAHEFT